MNTYENILSACYEGLVKAERNPELKQQLLQREGELLPRFAEHYGKLKHLPRRMRRSLQRQWKRSLAGIALLFALSATPAMAATINVGGACTLVRAIVAANNDTTATGHCKKGSGADTIVLRSKSTQTLTAVNNTNYGPTGLPTIRGVLTINGNGSSIRRSSGAPAFRILAVAESAKLTLQSATISGGKTVTAPGIQYSGNGGGLLNYAGVVTLTNVTVSGDGAQNGGGVSNVGGGRYNTRDGTLTAINSTISGNTASGVGGGVYNVGRSSYRGDVTLTKSVVSGNKANGQGGGIANNGYANADIINSTISGNIAGDGGGGLFNIYYSGTGLTNSTISGNRTGGSGGGVYNLARASLDATNSTISGNTAKHGGGIANDSGFTTLTHTTVSGNNGGTNGGGVLNSASIIPMGSVELERALISGNTAASGREVFNDQYATATAADFNVFGHKGETNAQALVGFTPSGTDITATSNGNRPTALAKILNTTLASNGGPTKTHALVAGSPAIDAMNNGTCPPPAKDQRGVKRPRDGNGDGGPACDVGSFER